MDAKNELTRCRRKVTLLKKRGLVAGNEEFDYWAERLAQFENIVFEEMIHELEAEYGPIAIEKNIIASGELQVTAYASGRYIKHLDQRLIPITLLDALPTCHDYRENNPPCARCGGVGTQLHHWAPQHLFNDASEWPTDYLCLKCHRRWHDTILDHYDGRNNGR